MEYFSSDGELGFKQDAGVRIHGGQTRQASQKSLRLYARNEYGKEYFNYSLLPQKPVDQYKRFLLGTTMAGWSETVIRDVFAQDASRLLDADLQDFQPVLIYLNGEYWGIQTIRDRIDKNFIAYTHGVDQDSIEFREEALEDHQNLMDFIELNPMTSNDNYEYITVKFHKVVG